MINPALNLHTLLDEAYNNSVSSDEYQGTWMKVFNIVDKNYDDTFSFLYEEEKIALMDSISSMLGLYNETKSLVEKNPKLNSEKNQKHLSTIGKALYAIDFEGTMAHFHRTIDQETLTALSYIADTIGLVFDINEGSINSDEVDKLIAEVDDLISAIDESNLPNDAKFILVQNLHNIRKSLFECKFLGIDALIPALEQSLGSLYFNHQHLEPISNEENFSRFFRVLERVNTLCSVGTAVKELALPFFGNLIK